MKEVLNGNETVELSSVATATIRVRAGYATTTKGVATPDRTIEITCPIDKVDEVMPILAEKLHEADVILKNDIKNNGYTCCSSEE